MAPASRSEPAVLTARAILLAVLSGALSYAACFLPDGIGTRWGAGLLFGVLVLGPSERGTARFLTLTAVSVAVYRTAVWLAHTLHVEASVPAVAACALSGFLGAVGLSAGVRAVRGSRGRPWGIPLAAVAGAFAGGLIGLAVEAEDGSWSLHLLLLAGFVGWQVGYAAAHRLAPRAGSAT